MPCWYWHQFGISAKRIIPDILCLYIALTSLIAFEPVKLLGILISLPFLLAALLWVGMGGGDIKLMAAAELVLEFHLGMAVMVMAYTAKSNYLN